MEVLPAPDGAVIIKILLLIVICKEKKEKGINIEADRLSFTIDIPKINLRKKWGANTPE
jgi:hypothetical protein